MRYKLNRRIDVITESTTVKQDKMSGWWCVNQGSDYAIIDGVKIDPGQGIDQYRDLPANVEYAEPIKIVCMPGAEVVLTQLFYSEVKAIGEAE